MTADLLAAHALHQVGEAVGAGVEIGVIDLVRVAGEDNAGIHSGAGDNGFDLVRGKVLRFIDDEEVIGSSAHECR